jgi:BASS family bile acid:Na+ symporter
MVFLASSSVILAPVLLRYLSQFVSAGPAQIDATRLVATLFATQLLPLCVGMSVRQWHPVLADRLETPAILLSKVLNLLAVGLILVTQFHFLLEVRPRGFFGMIALLVISCTAGWLISRAATGIRKALAVTTSLRNVAVALVIATDTFPGTPAVTAVVAFGLVSLLGTLCFAKLAQVALPEPTTTVCVRS